MELLSPACFSGLPLNERWQQIYLALGGTDDCLSGAPILEVQRAILALLGSEGCIHSPEDFWRAWAAFLGIECVESSMDAQRQIYAYYYDQAGDSTLVSPACFGGLGSDGQFLAFFQGVSEGDNPPEYDPDALLFFERNANAGQPLDSSEKESYNALFVELKEAGAYSKLDRLEIRYANARVPVLVGAGPETLENGNLTPDDENGLQMDGVGHADTGWPANTASHDNAFAYSFVSGVGSSGVIDRIIFGSQNTGGANVLALQSRENGNQVARAFCNNVGAVGFATGDGSTSPQTVALSSTSATSLKVYTNGVETDSVATPRSGPLTSRNIFLGALNDNDVAILPDTGSVLCLALGAEGLTASEVAAFNAAILRFDRDIRGTAYLYATFATDDETMRMFVSPDAENFRRVPVAYTPASGTVRDCSLQVDSEGTIWLAHTSISLGTGDSFALAKSIDGGATFTPVTAVSLAAISGVTHVWSPEWIVDPVDDSVHILVAVSVDGFDGPFQIYEVHPTNAGRTTWSAPVLVAGGVRPNMIDPFSTIQGGVYRLWFKNEDTKFIETATASSLTGTYALEQTGDWAGWGDELEGFGVAAVEGGHNAYMDQYGVGTGLGYSFSANLSGGSAGTWTALQSINSGGQDTRHGTVVELPSS